MTSPKNLIVFPILETFLKLLLDRQWHNKAFIKNKWKQLIPPEYFARRARSNPHWSKQRGKTICFTRTIEGIVDRIFYRTVFNGLESEYIEIRELGSKRLENYDIRITDKGICRVEDGVSGFRVLTFNGETHSIRVWSEKLDVSYQRFRFWLLKKHVPFEEAIAKSKKNAPHANSRMITYAGETKSISEWCRVLNVNRSKMSRYLRTMTFEGALERCRASQQC